MRRVSNEIREAIRQDRLNGVPIKNVAKQYGLTVQTICNITREGCRVPLAERRAKDSLIVECLLSGLSYQQTQDVVAVPYDKVYRVARRKGCLRCVARFNGRRYLKVAHKIWEMNPAGLRLVFGNEFNAVWESINITSKKSLELAK
jgi:hypothetical protein